MQPFVKATTPPSEYQLAEDSLLAELLKRFPSEEKEKLAKIAREATIDGLKGQAWLNDTYQVVVREAEILTNWPAMIHMSIKRIDREIIRDWRELQEIKNLIMGPEYEAVELFPAESRLVDSANQYHLWVLASPEIHFPFGFLDRLVTNDAIGKSKQRPRDA